MATPNSRQKMSSDFELPTGNGNYGMVIVVSFIPDPGVVISDLICSLLSPLALHVAPLPRSEHNFTYGGLLYLLYDLELDLRAVVDHGNPTILYRIFNFRRVLPSIFSLAHIRCAAIYYQQSVGQAYYNLKNCTCNENPTISIDLTVLSFQMFLF